jgi:hypothetical protein
VTLRNPMFSARFWNGKDAILKERLFDWQIIKEIMEKIKELYFIKSRLLPNCYLYKYPQSEFPYGELESKTSEAEKNQNMKY